VCQDSASSRNWLEFNSFLLEKIFMTPWRQCIFIQYVEIPPKGVGKKEHEF